MEGVKSIISLLDESLPPCFPRKATGKLTFGLVNPKTLANRDSAGTGPAGRFTCGKVVWYTKAGFLEFLATFLEDSTTSGERL